MRFGFASAVAALVLASLPAFVLAATVPSAIYTDPPHDAKFPASTAVLHIPTHGVAINGLAYLPSGPGAHPVLLICHGLPGNEKNLDLAQAVRRAGWVAVTFNYRGSWGSPGTFSFPGNLDDAAAVLTYLRDPHNAASLRLDPKRIVIAGHSMGGWVAAKTAARDSGLLGAVLISAWDPARPMTHRNAVAFMASDMESLAGVTAESMAAEREAHIKELSLIDAASGLGANACWYSVPTTGSRPAPTHSSKRFAQVAVTAMSRPNTSPRITAGLTGESHSRRALSAGCRNCPRRHRERSGRMPHWSKIVRICVSDGVPKRSLLVAIGVGTVLNLINQGDALIGHGHFDPIKAALTFAVPYCVATYGPCPTV
jgi:acetyl esterase/lipase